MVNEIVISKMEQRKGNPQLNDVEFNIHWYKLTNSDFYLHRIKKDSKIIFVEDEVDGFRLGLNFDNIFNPKNEDIEVIIVLKGDNIKYFYEKDFVDFLKKYSVLTDMGTTLLRFIYEEGFGEYILKKYLKYLNNEEVFLLKEIKKSK